MPKIKRILDSVHGTIFLEDWLFKFIDTPTFQRLRRVEQTSTRSIFPSARHDRFVHSLGVYHIGNEIVNQIRTEVGSIKELGDYIKKGDIDTIYNSYEVACLLHDVGHSPFSHTFEEYFGERKDLCNQLAEIFNGIFSIDVWEEIRKAEENGNENNLPKWHECTSAILCCMPPLVDIIKKKGLDLELIVRMITGIKYSEETGTTGIDSFKNCFIELLHGEIDADRIDYACRDTWAAGYSTTTVDARSLVSCIHIRKNPDNEKAYCVCFDKRAISDIENVFGVKNFQSLHVFNHHTIVYEQYLLDKAVKTMSVRRGENSLMRIITNVLGEICHCKKEDVKSSMHRIFNVDSLRDCKEGEFKYLCDDDLIVELKKDNNVYYQEWSSRNYKKIALWKSYEDFMYLLRDIPKPLKVVSSKEVTEELGEAIRKEIKEFKYPESENEYERYYIKNMEMKAQVNLSQLYLLIGDDVVRYDKLFQFEKQKISSSFPYIFVEVPVEYINNKDYFRKIMINKLGDKIKSLYTK